jgi:hydroxymethylpyrimidine/phosphomethylpyrimidine kinase
MTAAVACTIAGSDSGGGAGIQADLKTFAACGVYGASAIVALTAQNTIGVRRVMLADLEIVADQVDAVAEDLQPDAWKTGMLGNAAIIEVVVDRLRRHRARNLVVDPVMIAKSGDLLLESSAITSMRELLLPLAMVLTPNIPEAEELLGHPVEGPAGAARASAELASMGPRVVVVKGGHSGADPVVDVVYDSANGAPIELTYPRVGGSSTHGTGCTLSAAIAAHLALGEEPLEAITKARAYLQAALLRAPGLGSGHGPLGHSEFTDTH